MCVCVCAWLRECVHVRGGGGGSRLANDLPHRVYYRTPLHDCKIVKHNYDLLTTLVESLSAQFEGQSGLLFTMPWASIHHKREKYTSYWWHFFLIISMQNCTVWISQYCYNTVHRKKISSESTFYLQLGKYLKLHHSKVTVSVTQHICNIPG